MTFHGDDGLQQVIAALDPVRRDSNGYLALCPGHDDQQPSLSFRLGDNDFVVFNCHAGCSYDQIVAGLGITPRPKNTPVTRKPLRSFEYHDRDGNVVAIKNRRSGKGNKIYWTQPDGTSGLAGVRVGLYRLPEVIRGVSDRSVIWLAEGERDADTLAADGLVATTGPHGAKSWEQSGSEMLAGADAVVVADRDATGIDGARKRATALTAAGCTVNILVPPQPYKDVTDLYEAGFSISELVDLDEQQPIERIPVKYQEKNGRPLFAMPPMTWFNTLDPHCFLLASLLDYFQGAGNEPHRGKRRLAKCLGWSRSLLDTHLDHLVGKGTLTVNQVGNKMAEYRINNPARKSGGPPAGPPVDRLPVHQAYGSGPSGEPLPRSSGLNKVSEVDAVIKAFPGAEKVELES
jgi:hypothetical protein